MKIIKKNEETIREKNLKIFKNILIYFTIGVFSFFLLMLFHRPPVYFRDSFIEFIIYIYNLLGFKRTFFLLLGYALQWGVLMSFFLVAFKIRVLGNIILLMFSFFIGVELYYFFLQGGETSWNVGFNEMMLSNVLKIFNNSDLATEAASQYLGSSIFYIYLIIVPIVIFIFFYFLKENMPKLKYPVVALPIIIYMLSITNGTEFYRVPYMFRVFYEIQRKATEDMMDKIHKVKREDIYLKLDKNIKNKPKNIILVVSESIRGDFVSINSNDPEIKKATPFLTFLKNKNLLKSFGVMYSMGNCSSASNKYLMNGGLRKNAKTAPTIYQYMKSAGYTTTRIDAPHNGYMNGVFKYDNPYIDNYISNEDVVPSYNRDFTSLLDIKEILNNGKSNFIYLTKHGAHFPIGKQYPKEKELFKTAGLKKHSEKLNKYEYLNTINWTVDTFFKELMKIVDKDTLIVWVSDHGVNIYRDREDKEIVLTHCESGFDHYNALFNVPGAFISKNKKYLAGLKNLKESSTAQILPTILKVIGYKDIEDKYWKPFQDGIVTRDEKNYPLFSYGDPGYLTKDNFILNEGNESIEFEDKVYGLNKRKILE